MIRDRISIRFHRMYEDRKEGCVHMRKSKDLYNYPPEHFKNGNVSVTLYRPILTPEERKRREDRLKKVTADIMRPLVFPELYEHEGSR